MNEPITTERLAEMRARAEQATYAADVLADDVLELLDEVDRLRGCEEDRDLAFRYSEMDGSPRYIRVDEKTFRAHKPDGHRADRSPYWNYVRVTRRKAGKWTPIGDQ